MQKNILSLFFIFLLFTTDKMYADVSNAEYDSLSLILNRYQFDVEDDSIVRQRIIENRMSHLLEPYSQNMEYHIDSDIYNSTYIQKILVIVKIIFSPQYLYI